jgi:hypothetical protein
MHRTPLRLRGRLDTNNLRTSKTIMNQSIINFETILYLLIGGTIRATMLILGVSKFWSIGLVNDQSGTARSSLHLFFRPRDTLAPPVVTPPLFSDHVGANNPQSLPTNLVQVAWEKAHAYVCDQMPPSAAAAKHGAILIFIQKSIW